MVPLPLTPLGCGIVGIADGSHSAGARIATSSKKMLDHQGYTATPTAWSLWSGVESTTISPPEGHPGESGGVRGGDHFSGAGEVLTWVSSLPGAAPVQDQQWQGLVDPCEPTFLMPVVRAGIRVADSGAPQWIGHAAFGPGPAIPERPLTVDVSLPAAEDTTDTHQAPEYRDVELPAWRSIKGYPNVSARSSAIARRRQAGASRVPVTPLDSARPQ